MFVCKHSLYNDPLGSTLSDDNTLKSETENIYYNNLIYPGRSIDQHHAMSFWVLTHPRNLT